MDNEPQTRIAAEDYLDALAAHGIDYLFCNPGTDFAPIVEAFARAAAQQPEGSAPDGRAARECCAVHGTWLHDGDRPTTGGDAAHQCWHRQFDQYADRCQPRPHSGAADIWAHAIHRSRRQRLAQRAHPLGAGDVRPGWHAARDGEMGLRNEARRSGCKRGGSRAGTGDDVTQGPGLSLAAARGAWRSGADASGKRSRPSQRATCAGAVAGGYRAACRMDWRSARPGGDHRVARSGSTRCCGAVATGRAVGVAGHPLHQPVLRHSRPIIRCSRVRCRDHC